jgi:ferric-dicitrate binding protein FerR (iron transport regulator)
MEEKKMEEEKIIKFISGQLQEVEKEEVLKWVSASPENKEEYYKLKNLWALTVQFRVPLKTNITDKEVFRHNIRKRKLKVLKANVTIFVKYAAVVVITLLAGKYIYQNSTDNTLTYNEIIVPPGQMAQVELSDGTNVSINSSSRLKYPIHFNSGERKVFLSGEAYFEVSKGKSPFIVDAGIQLVKVVGTKFNVMAYTGDKYFQATLTEGKIELLDSMGKSMAVLQPGEQFSLDVPNNKGIVRQVQTDLYDSWKDGIYIFDHETLSGITERLERIFAVKIYIENDRIRNYKFTGTISRNVPFEQILKIIQISAPIKYKLKEVHGAIEEVKLY